MTTTVSLRGARERKPASSLQQEASPDQLPPILRLKGRTLVIKLGGSTDVSPRRSHRGRVR